MIFSCCFFNFFFEHVNTTVTFVGLPIVCLFKIPLLCMGENDKEQESAAVCHWPERIRTRFYHESESLVSNFSGYNWLNVPDKTGVARG